MVAREWACWAGIGKEEEMKWYSVEKHGLPDDVRVLTYSMTYDGKPEMAYRLLDGQFVRICSEVTHYMYLEPPKIKGGPAKAKCQHEWEPWGLRDVKICKLCSVVQR